MVLALAFALMTGESRCRGTGTMAQQLRKLRHVHIRDVGNLTSGRRRQCFSKSVREDEYRPLVDHFVEF